jgi:hypothetical protein
LTDPVTKPPRSYQHVFSLIGEREEIIGEVVLRFRLDNEIVPIGQAARTFRGYPTLFHALVAARTTSNIGLIYQMAFDPSMSRQDNPFWFGTFFVFDTGMKPLSPRLTQRVAPNLSPAGVINVQFTNLQAATDTRTWVERTAELDAAITDQKPQQGLAHSLAAKILRDFAMDTLEVIADPRVERRAIRWEERNALSSSHAVNLHLLPRSDQYLSDQRPAFTTLKSPAWGVAEPERFGLRTATEAPVPYIALTQKAFWPTHPAVMLASCAHEAVHMRHYSAAGRVVERWRASGPGPRDHFSVWLWERSRKARSGVSPYDFLLGRSLIGDVRADNSIHFEPHLECFSLLLSFLPVHVLKSKQREASYPIVVGDLTMIEKYYRRSDRPEFALAHLKPRIRLLGGAVGRERSQLVRREVGKVMTEPGGHPFLEWFLEQWPT